MIDVSTLPGTARAAVLVGAVLVESMALYAGYGVVTHALAPGVRRILGDE
ncbi:hypothetical protein ACFR97_06490 [Haloplanus litoreus]|uniref:Uncharacterized protein n=1 Tax=Haloplanus litoreus TaxID=767515 RepID=A0ABD5ZZ14_9EURY